MQLCQIILLTQSHLSASKHHFFMIYTYFNILGSIGLVHWVKPIPCLRHGVVLLLKVIWNSYVLHIIIWTHFNCKTNTVGINWKKHNASNVKIIFKRSRPQGLHSEEIIKKNIDFSISHIICYTKFPFLAYCALQ